MSNRNITEDDIVTKLVSEAASKIEDTYYEEETNSEQNHLNDIATMDEEKKEKELSRLVEDVKKNVDDIDGVRIFERRDDGLYLTVYPPTGNGKPISLEDIKNDLERYKVNDIDEDWVKKIVIEAQGQTIKVANIEQMLNEDGSAVVTVSDDKMQGFLQVIPPKGTGKPVEFNQILEIIKAEGIAYGLDEKQVEIAIQLAETSERVLIAKGKPVVDGRDAQIDYKFEINGIKISPTELANGKVDFYNLNLIQNIDSGQVLASKLPPTEGEEGWNVLGIVLNPKPGRDKVIKAGKNTELIDDESTLIATESGHVSYIGGKVLVSPVYEVDGDVNFSTGNIDFVGSVLIKGVIEEGFHVKAEGDVEVNGSITGGNVECGGHLTVKGGIVGKGKARIKARGNLFAKFIENAFIDVGGEAMIGEAIMHSTVNANVSVHVGGKKGVIVGGIVRAGDEINAKIIGSNFATATALEAGVSPELRLQYNQCCKALDEAKGNLDKTRKAFLLLKDMEKNHGSLPTEKKAMLVKVSRAQFQLMDAVEKLSQQQQNLMEQLESADTGTIKVSSVVHPGVSITIGYAKLHVHDDIQYVQFINQGGEISTVPLS